MFPEILIDRWLRLCRIAGGDSQVISHHLADLAMRYEEGHRVYHDCSHIVRCLGIFDELRRPGHDSVSVELAIWYHDAVYLPGNPNNEIESARLLRSAAERLGFGEPIVEKAVRLILGTRHAAPNPAVRDGSDDRQSEHDLDLIRDVDLSILGTGRREYDRYAASIRAEYAHVDSRRFATGRASMLREFLARDSIFSLPEAFDRFETAARENLTRELEHYRD